jgi:putative ABC transport system substrate-binding protein
MGFAQSLARPGGNITGLSILAGDISQKRLELLRQAVPRAKVAGYLLQSANPGNAVFVSATKTAARSLGFRIHVLEVGAANESEQAFAAICSSYGTWRCHMTKMIFNHFARSAR